VYLLVNDLTQDDFKLPKYLGTELQNNRFIVTYSIVWNTYCLNESYLYILIQYTVRPNIFAVLISQFWPKTTISSDQYIIWNSCQNDKIVKPWKSVSNPLNVIITRFVYSSTKHCTNVRIRNAYKYLLQDALKVGRHYSS
jgi:hypothetical protein